jgi:simple sugar transport system permease protein
MWSDLLTQAIVVSVLATTLQSATPILLAALGETVAENAGVYNMGLEGTMLFGAFAAYMATWGSGSPWIGVLAGLGGGAAASLALAGLAVALRGEQIVAGLAINLLAAGLCAFLYKLAVGSGDPPVIPILTALPLGKLAELPWLGPILFRQKALTYLALALVPLVGTALFRSRAGLELRGVGENPAVLEARGLGVRGRQAAAVLVCGGLAGLGGAFLTAGSAVRFAPEIVNGRGWLAIVAVVAGGWRPGGVLVATLCFAFLDALQLQAQGVGARLPFQAMLAAPYAVSIAMLALSGSGRRPPAMLGIPFQGR